VGFNVLRKLYSERHRIKVLVRSKTELFEGFEIETVKGDITDKKSLKGFCNHLNVVTSYGIGFRLITILTKNGFRLSGK
jgi:nucleoside-diphosphate-sugar epimerase